MLFWVLQSESVGLRHAAAAGVLTVSAVVAGWDWFHSIEGITLASNKLTKKTYSFVRTGCFELVVVFF